MIMPYSLWSFESAKMLLFLILYSCIYLTESTWRIRVHQQANLNEQVVYHQRRQLKALPSVPNADTDPSKRYAIFVDAGSSGSRVYIYWYRVSSASELPVIDFVKASNVGGSGNGIATLKVSPGLSNFHSNLSGLDSYIGKLLDFAGQYVPIEKSQQTTLQILETVCI